MHQAHAPGQLGEDVAFHILCVQEHSVAKPQRVQRPAGGSHPQLSLLSSSLRKGVRPQHSQHCQTTRNNLTSRCRTSAYFRIREGWGLGTRLQRSWPWAAHMIGIWPDHYCRPNLHIRKPVNVTRMELLEVETNPQKTTQFQCQWIELTDWHSWTLAGMTEIKEYVTAQRTIYMYIAIYTVKRYTLFVTYACP